MPNIKALSLLPLFLMLSLNFQAASYAEDAAPSQAIQSFLEAAKSMEFPIKDTAAHQEKVQRADAYLDLEAMGRKGLAANWDAASPEDQKAFMELLWKLIENIAYPRTRKFLDTKTVEYKEPKSIEKGFEVESTVKDPQAELNVPIVYYVAQENGQWKIYDIFLDGISMTEDLSYQFDKLIRDSGFSGLLTRMRERLAQAEKETLGA